MQPQLLVMLDMYRKQGFRLPLSRLPVKHSQAKQGWDGAERLCPCTYHRVALILPYNMVWHGCRANAQGQMPMLRNSADPNCSDWASGDLVRGYVKLVGQS